MDDNHLRKFSRVISSYSGSSSSHGACYIFWRYRGLISTIHDILLIGPAFHTESKTGVVSSPISFHFISLTKLMASHDLLHSTVTNQIACNQRDLYSTPELERMMDCRCQVLVSKLETSDTITFT